MFLVYHQVKERQITNIKHFFIPRRPETFPSPLLFCFFVCFFSSIFISFFLRHFVGAPKGMLSLGYSFNVNSYQQMVVCYKEHIREHLVKMIFEKATYRRWLEETEKISFKNEDNLGKKKKTFLRLLISPKQTHWKYLKNPRR